MSESMKLIIDDELTSSENSVFLIKSDLEVIYINSIAEKEFYQNIKDSPLKLDALLGIENSENLRKSISKIVDTESLDEIGDFQYRGKSYRIFCNHVRRSNGIFRITVEETSKVKNFISKSIRKKKLETLGKLTSSIAHEINSPLQYVSDNVKFMEDGFKRFTSILQALEENSFFSDSKIMELYDEKRIPFFKSEIPEAIDHTLEGLTRITDIIKAIKEFSHPGWSEKSHININKMLRMTTVLMRNKWKYNINIHFDLDNALPDFYGYVSEMNQVFANIINNAIEAFREANDLKKKGNIYISTSWNYKWIIVEIKNDGPLIEEAIFKKMFKSFFTTKDIGYGTGQGLSLCKNIVEKHHSGKIEAVSSKNEMTKFTIYLPVDWELLEDVE